MAIKNALQDSPQDQETQKNSLMFGFLRICHMIIIVWLVLFQGEDNFITMLESIWIKKSAKIMEQVLVYMLYQFLGF